MVIRDVLWSSRAAAGVASQWGQPNFAHITSSVAPQLCVRHNMPSSTILHVIVIVASLGMFPPSSRSVQRIGGSRRPSIIDSLIRNTEYMFRHRLSSRAGVFNTFRDFSQVDGFGRDSNHQCDSVTCGESQRAIRLLPS
jgi:hypothetical protein